MGLCDIVIDPRNPNYFCTGGSDAYARVYDIRKLQQGYASRYVDEPVDIFCPDHLIETNKIWVTGLAYSKSSELVVSYYNDLIYLFQKNMGLGRPSPSSTLPQDIDKPQVFLGHRNTFTTTGVSFFGPNYDYVMSGSSCGHIFIWKKNGAEVIRVMKGKADQIEPHPNLPIIATCRAENNVKLWAPIAKADHSLNIEQELDGHKERVGTVHFNSRGDLLVSGGDEKQIIIWDWETKTRRLAYDSGHFTVQDTKIMPLSDDKKIATACMDGQVRLGEVFEDGRVHTKNLGSYDDVGVCSLAVEPGDPHSFYSCGEDGFVRQFDLRSSCARELLHCSRLSKGKRNPRQMALSDIVIDPRNPNYFCTGGSDVYARVYDIRKLQQRYASRYLDEPVDIFCPDHLIETSKIWVTGLAYSKSSELVVNYYNDLIYLFQKNMGLGWPSPSSTLPQDIDKPQVFLGHRNKFCSTGVSFFGPNDDYVMSGSSCGHIFIWKKNGAKVIRVMKGKADQIEPHPNLPIIATCGSEKNVKLWAPIANDDHSLDIEQLMESNRKVREKVRQIYLLRSSVYDLEIQVQPMGEEISNSLCLGWDID